MRFFRGGINKGEMECPRCSYRWKPRISQPKRCPLCSHLLPYWRKKRGEMLAGRRK